MKEPGFESNQISEDISDHIQKFENANCFNRVPTTLTHAEQQQLR